MSSTKPVVIESGRLERILGAAFAPVVTISELIKNASDACLRKGDIIRVEIDTLSKTITISDNGTGFSMADIESLRHPGHSLKMINGNHLSKIGEPYAGSKGLGILTAFNLCTHLEITTHSVDDNCAYKIDWKRGSAQINITELKHEFSGTQLVLTGVSKDDLDLLVDGDELKKLFISSITYYINSESLPLIEFYLDKKNVTSRPSIKIEQVYNLNNKPKTKKQGFFVAKATFRYSKNILTLSYEDNERQLFSFVDELIDLSDISSLKNFIFKHKIGFRNLDEIWENFKKYSQTVIDDFEGCYYIWRDKKDENLERYPYGVRIYVNNYGLYRYLNSDDDWLQHTEISQNIRNTNFKLRNTYGYIAFKNYNESDSGLRISNDRNDFVINLPQKKFMHIMRHFVSGIFSYIDIAMRNFSNDATSLKPRHPKRNVFPGQVLSLYDLVVTEIPFDQIEICADDGVVIDLAEGTVYSNLIGIHHIWFRCGSIDICIDIDVKDPTPTFSLTRSTVKAQEPESINLRQFISQSSVVNININDIIISAVTPVTVIKNDIFTGDNHPGIHVISFSYNNEEYPIVKNLKIDLRLRRIREANKFKNIFPNYQNVDEYFKIRDIINEISECYTRYPTICMVSMRTLIEISLKSYEEKIYKVKVDNSSEYSIDGKMKWIYDQVASGDSKIDNQLLQKYQLMFASTRKKTIEFYKKLRLNIYVHENDVTATQSEVFVAAKRFKYIINFIIDSLVAKQTSV